MDGTVVCFCCGRSGHYIANCLEFSQTRPSQSNQEQAQNSNRYTPNPNHNTWRGGSPRGQMPSTHGVSDSSGSRGTQRDQRETMEHPSQEETETMQVKATQTAPCLDEDEIDHRNVYFLQWGNPFLAPVANLDWQAVNPNWLRGFSDTDQRPTESPSERLQPSSRTNWGRDRPSNVSNGAEGRQEGENTSHNRPTAQTPLTRKL
uniref:CCHC-type domain-containing protein n=1 Tax=Romanomermis culicivorax TaxID=13658 RepID=A0A915JWX9_ROMCU